jgi:hypothetical protein
MSFLAVKVNVGKLAALRGSLTLLLGKSLQ